MNRKISGIINNNNNTCIKDNNIHNGSKTKLKSNCTDF